MPITAVDPKSALVVIDMQKGIAKMPAVHPVGEIVRNVVRLVDAFRLRTRPIVLVHVGWSADGADAISTRTQLPGPSPATLAPEFFEYMDELQADAKRDILIQKRQWGAFYGTVSRFAASPAGDFERRPMRYRDQHRRGVHRARCVGAFV